MSTKRANIIDYTRSLESHIKEFRVQIGTGRKTTFEEQLFQHPPNQDFQSKKCVEAILLSRIIRFDVIQFLDSYPSLTFEKLGILTIPSFLTTTCSCRNWNNNTLLVSENLGSDNQSCSLLLSQSIYITTQESKRNSN